MEVVITAKTVKNAVELGAQELGKAASEVQYEVLEDAKKGFLGMGATEAKVRVYFEEKVTAESLALDFINNIITNMGVNAAAKVDRIDERIVEKGKTTIEKDVYISIDGENLGILIGRHGDVLDSIQYLANIAAARYPRTEDKHVFVKIIIDIENYRQKRAETLRALARRMASKALSYGRNLTLEPMSGYERRIIHSEIQNIDGVYTYSIGQDSDRRIVIALGDAPEAEETQE